MNNFKKKSLLTKYAPMAKAGASATELKNAITEGEADLPADHIDEVVLELINEREDSDEQPGAGTDTAAPAVSSGVPGKKKYDIMKGRWWATKIIRNPFDGKELVIEWEFRPEGKPKMTGVVVEPHKAQSFNDAFKIRHNQPFAEQLVEQGSTAKILDKLDNPFEQIQVIQN